MEHAASEPQPADVQTVVRGPDKESPALAADAAPPHSLSIAAAAVAASSSPSAAPVSNVPSVTAPSAALEQELQGDERIDPSAAEEEALAAEEDAGDVTITGPDDDADESAGPNDSKQSLSTDEVVELRQFNEKKAQIEEQYKLIQSRPMPEIFTSLQPMDSSEAVVDATFAELPVRKAELQDWLAEHERIQNDAVAFNVADMNRLRTVARAAAERHMSPQDTDLIELTVETLVALDKLLMLLNERRRALDLLAARLDWEERRATCWKSYHTLMEDIGLFVQKRARWTAAVYSRASERPGLPDTGESPAASLLSHAATEESHVGPLPAAPGKPAPALPSESTQTLLLEALNAELNSLSARVRELVTELVPTAGEALDGLIDQCQVPDAYLEEQEELENLALEMTARGLFITSLASQWRKAHELFLATRSLHFDAKELLADAEAIRGQVPSQELFDKMAITSAALNARLEELAGPTARRFVYNPTQSAHTLVFSSANHLPTPMHEAWPDQVGQNALIATHLDRDLAAAAKRTRQAAMSVESYSRGLAAAQRADALQRRLHQAAGSLQGIKVLAVDGFNPGPGTSASGNADSGAPPDFSSVECLLPSRHSVYARRLPDEQKRARTMISEAEANVEELNRNLATCARHGLSHSGIKQNGTSAIAAYRNAQQGADAALGEGAQLVALLQQARTINTSTVRLQGDVAQLKGELDSATKSPAFSPKGKGWDVTLAPRPTPVEAKDRLKECSEALSQLSAQMSAMHAMPRAVTASSIRESLETERNRLAQQVSQLGALVNWYASLHQQEASLRPLNRQMGILRKQAMDIKERAFGKRSTPPDVVALQSAQVSFEEAVSAFERRAATGTVLTGDPPDNLDSLDDMPVLSSLMHKARRASLDLKGKLDLRSYDEEVRDTVNGWCADAKALQEQVAAAVETVKQEAERLKPIVEATNQRNMRFEAAVTAAMDAVQQLGDELDTRETGFQELISTSSSFGELRAYRDESREALTAKEQAVGSRLDSLRECQREMISSLYSTGKPVSGDKDSSSSTASAVKVRNAASTTIRAVRKTLTYFDDQLNQTTAGRRSMSTSFSKPGVEGDISVGDVSQDVFGPRQPTIFAQLPKATPSADFDALIQTLRNDQLDAQTVEDGQPQLDALLDLPDLALDRTVQTWWCSARAALEEPLQQAQSSSGHARLMAAIDKRQQSVLRHGQLKNFRQKASDLEQTISSLLNLLDFSGGRSATSSMENLSGRSSRATSPYLATLDQIEPLQQRLRQNLDELHTFSQPVIADARVIGRLGQLTRAAKDVLADAKEFGQTTDTSVVDPDALDETESVASTASSVASSLASVEEEGISTAADPEPDKAESQMKPPAQPHIRRPSTLVANGMPSTPVNASIRRSVSEQTPASTKLSSRLRRLKSNIGQPQTPRMTTPKATAPSPRFGASKLPVRTPSSEYKRTPAVSTPARYRANPKSKLDVAVGKIVNHLPVPVKVSHASVGPNAKKQETWKDESGRYWIGDPEPKLCFCRILRSRTVMVRVGGGWQELSSYIMQHYSHLAAATVSFPISPSGQRLPSNSPKAVRLNTTDLPWISSATMTRSSTLEVPPVVLTPADEDRRYRFGSEGLESGSVPRASMSASALTPSRSSTPALSISPSASPALSPSASASAVFDTFGTGSSVGAPQQRLRKVREGSSRQSLDISTLMPRLPSAHPAAAARRTPSPSTMEAGSRNVTLRGSPLHIRSGSLGPITPQRPLFTAGSPSPDGILPIFIRKEKAVPPFRTVSGSGKTQS
ncbi:hypothetical protein OC834_003157 [Tilletia horrida]|nr:hypothetical protein OC834_003157 [Tilletia horrida]